MLTGTTFLDKIWARNRITAQPDGRELIHIDRHILNDITSPIAFLKLRKAGRRVHSPELTLATQDHIVATDPGRSDDTYAPGAPFVRALRTNAVEEGVRLLDLDDPEQGIVHVVAAEQGFVLPGATVVCGDSHTCTLGALGALGFGIGTTEIEHVLATGTLWLRKPRTMRARLTGNAPAGLAAKDMILALIARCGADAGQGKAVEFCGSAVEQLDIDGRFTLCNMAIEMGSRFGLIAPDDKVFAYLQGRRYAPRGTDFDRAVEAWRMLRSDPDANFDAEVEIDLTSLAPQVSWGTSPDQTVGVFDAVPDPASLDTAAKREAAARALNYMGLTPGTPLNTIPIDTVYIGSCTNGRLSDLREAAAIIRGRTVAKGVRALVVPGSTAIKRAAEREGLDRIFIDAGFQWRESGCSMCCGLASDRLTEGERCASTSNRNFEGRQGKGGRTHLMSPASAAATAIEGRIADVRRYLS